MKKTHVQHIILNLFGKAITDISDISDGIVVPFKKMNELSVKCGYIVDPSVCNEDVLDWIKGQNIDYNSTFYKSWNSITSKSRFELFLDQIRHYLSTYGTDYTGEPYIAETDADVPALTTYKVILPITREEVIKRCVNMLSSGIALKEDTIQDIFTILDSFEYFIDASIIKNREALMYICKQRNILPTSAQEMIRFLIYLATDTTLLIKSDDVIKKIKANPIDIESYMDKFGYEALSTVFYRYKNILLAFKGNDNNVAVINHIRRLAKKNHIPVQKGYFETILSTPQDFPYLHEKLQFVTNFKKITLLQTILVRLKKLENRAFVIRNQKLYIKEEVVTVDKNYLKMVYNMIYDSLIHSLKDNACTVSLPVGVNVTLPTSEKSFIGNYPLGTSFDLSDSNAIVGINWRGEDGAKDLDLKLIDIDGNQYGWNASYYNSDKSVVFSGDMTYANPEASELFFASKGFTPAIVKVNLFNGDANSKFKFFIAKEKVTNMKKNYMVNQNNILITVDCQMDSKEKTLGVITENKFVLAQFRTGKGKVAHNSVTDLYTQYALATLDCYLSLEKVLTDAGFTITTEGDADYDLTNLSKDTLISLIQPQPVKKVKEFAV